MSVVASMPALWQSIRPQVARFGSASILIGASQTIAILSGILCIRILPVREYGIYLLGMAVMQLGVLLTDLGITGAATALIAGSKYPGRTLQSVRREMVVLRTILLAVLGVAVLVLSPWYFSKAETAEIRPVHLAILAASLFAMIWFHSQVSLYRGIAGVRDVAVMDVGTAALRACFTVGSVVAIATGTSGLVGVLLSYVSAAIVVSIGIAQRTDALTEEDSFADSPRALRTLFAPLVVPALFFAAQSYAVTFLMAQRGTLVDIGVYGAATRFTQVYSVLSSLNVALLQPYLSRLPASGSWPKYSLRVLALTVAIVAIIVAGAWAFAPQLTLILGSQYGAYSALIPLSFASASCYFLGTIVYGILISRGYTAGQWLTIPFGLAGMAAGFVVLNPRTATEFIYFEAFRCGAYLLCQLTLLAHWLYRREWVAAETLERTPCS